MDFKGQKLAEVVSVWLVTAFAVLGFLLGYVRQDFSSMMAVFGGGCALAFVASVPDWPAYNKHPIKWLPPKEQAAGKRGGSSGGAGGSGGPGPSHRKKKSASWSNFWGVMPGVAMV